MPTARPPDHATLAALWCAALLMAQFVGGRAARDALYLSHMPVETLPAVVLASALTSVVLALAWSRLLARIAPERFLVAALLAGGALFVAVWLLFLFPVATPVAAVLVYVQVTVLGPLLGSGLWLMASERFDPRTARAAFARMVSAGTVGGLVGGVLTERTAAAWGPFAVLLLAAASVAAAYQMHRLGGRVATSLERELPPELAPERTDSGLRVLANAPFLRNLAALVLLSALSAALLDFLFKSKAFSAIEPGAPLLRFFAWYYAAAGVLVFVVQTGAHRFALDRLGLARTVMAPAVAVVAGGLGAIVFPGWAGITMARGAESVLRGSLFRSAYEIFFTPVPVADKRAAKSLIDVGVDRIGEAAGAGLIALVVAGFGSRWQYPLLLMLAVAASIGAMVVARRLTRGYVEALERSLREQAVALSLSDVRDRTTRAVWQTMMTLPADVAARIGVTAGSHVAHPSSSISKACCRRTCARHSGRSSKTAGRARRWLRRVPRCLPVWSRRTRLSSSTFRHTHPRRARSVADRTEEGSPVPESRIEASMERPDQVTPVLLPPGRVVDGATSGYACRRKGSSYAA
jgi:hypothetical protein